MLRIERMEVVGFKSFPERTVISFPDGVTAVVGPNGSGKSNIVDAISWVLGEQSARALRGGRMEDVIFSGTEGRGPGGMAEVTLELRAADATLPEGKEKVSITRRLYRTGDSEYLMDGRSTRLLDIRNLLEQVRAGERTYAIVDQGRVGSFVTSRPRDRRQFIEDAAGVAGYRQRRRLAEMKLEATKANLLRVDDILREVERQRRSLQRQASLARRARRLDEELRTLKTLWYRRRALELGGRTAELSEYAAVAQREAEHLDAERGRQSQVVTQARARLEAAHATRTASVDEAHRLQIEEERLVAEIDAGEARAAALEEEAVRQESEGKRLALDRTARVAERDSLARDVDALDAQLAGLATEVGAAEARAEQTRAAHRVLSDEATHVERDLYECLHERAELAARLSAAREALAREGHRAEEARAAGRRLAAARAEAEASLDGTWNALQAADAEMQRGQQAVQAARQGEVDASRALDSARRELGELVSALDTRSGELAALESLAVRLAGADAAREVLEQARAGRLAARGVAADALEVDPEIESAADAFLAGLLPGVVVDGEAEVLRAAALPISGRVRFLPLDAVDGAGARPELPAELLADPRVRGRLVARVRPRAGWGAAVWERVEDAVLVDDLAAALSLHRQFPRFDFLTPEGHAVHRDGIVAVEGRGGDHDPGLLARARRREDLTREVEVLNSSHADAGMRVELARTQLDRARAERAVAEEAQAEARGRAATAKMAWEQAGRELERLTREATLIAGVLEVAERGCEEASGRAASLETQLGELENRIVEARAGLETARSCVQDHDDELRGSSLALAALLADVRAHEERRASLARELDRLSRELAELIEKSDRGAEAGRRAHEDAGESRARAVRRRAELETARARRAVAETEAASAAERLALENAAVREAEARLDIVLQQLEDARARREQRVTEFERSRLELEHLVTTCREELGTAPTDLPERVPELEEGIRGLEMVDDDAALAGRIADVRGRRERVGPVNPLAEQEYDELSVRFEEQSGQKQDLESTIDELNASIRKMDRESKERFLDAFAEIRRHFREQFALLFRGGRADLLLEDEGNPLESGVEIVCQPPGKKLQSVSLLSGGEKALAATAVLFAIFRYAPPPFCLLDEVDAPLDDANVGRFADALRGFCDQTQFIVITHNKRSMEMADLLYGVTMAEPGVSKLVSMTLD